MSALNALQDALDGLLGSRPRLSAGDLAAIDPLLNRETTLAIISDVINDPAALTVVAARSYTHSLGFKKITLLEPQLTAPAGSPSSYQLRLHLWTPGNQNAVSLVESKHEHSFDFISRVLLGEMENQCYTRQQLSADEKALVLRLQAQLVTLQDEQRMAAHQGMEALHAIRLDKLGSEQALKEGISCDQNRLMELLACTEEELIAIANLHGRYEYDPVASKFGGDYVHSLTGVVRLVPEVVLKLQEGDLYHHPHKFIHRLYIPSQENATIIITTPRTSGGNGASFQHPTWFSGEAARYPRRMYTVDELVQVLTTFRELLEKNSVRNSGRQLDVAHSSQISADCS